MKIRPYQEEAIASFFADYEQDPQGSGLLYLATGAGKTVIASEIAKRLGGNKKTLFLCHREELAQQTISKFMVCWPGVDIGLVKAQHNMLGRQVTVASIQTVSSDKRLAQLLEYEYELVIIDECHHVSSVTWKKVVNAQKCYKLGLTATPQRTDKVRLDDVFSKILYRYTIIDGIEQGYLCDIEGKVIQTEISLDGVKMTAGDFNTKSLSEIMTNPEMVKFVCQKWEQEAVDRKTVFFGVDVNHCKMIAAELRRMGYKAEWVAGEMKPEERAQTLQAFSRDKTQVLASCMLLTEGWDEPSVNCIAMARPTSSESLYTQMIGRGLRLYPDKENCRLLDFVCASDKHRVMQLGILAGKEMKVKEGSETKTSGGSAPKDIQSVKLLISKDKEFKLQTQRADEVRRYDWIHTDDGLWVIGLGNQHLGYLVLSQADDGWVIDHLSTVGWEDSANRMTNSPMPLDWCISMAEQEAERLADDVLKYASKEEQGWWTGGPTDKQKAIISRAGKTVPKTRKEASKILNEIFFGWFMKRRSKANPKQIMEIRAAYYSDSLPFPLTLERINRMTSGEYVRLQEKLVKKAERSFYA